VRLKNDQHKSIFWEEMQYMHKSYPFLLLLLIYVVSGAIVSVYSVVELDNSQYPLRNIKNSTLVLFRPLYFPRKSPCSTWLVYWVIAAE